MQTLCLLTCAVLLSNPSARGVPTPEQITNGATWTGQMLLKSTGLQ